MDVTKERITVSFEKPVFDKIVAQRANPEHARKSLNRIINELLKKGLEEVSKAESK